MVKMKWAAKIAADFAGSADYSDKPVSIKKH
jgi:hypothetical protein